MVNWNVGNYTLFPPRDGARLVQEIRKRFPESHKEFMNSVCSTGGPSLEQKLEAEELYGNALLQISSITQRMLSHHEEKPLPEKICDVYATITGSARLVAFSLLKEMIDELPDKKIAVATAKALGTALTNGFNQLDYSYSSLILHEFLDER